MAESLKVVAVERGFYNILFREKGAKFVLTDRRHFSHNWMKAEGWTPDAAKPATTANNLYAENQALKAQLSDLQKQSDASESLKNTLQEQVDSLVSQVKDLKAKKTPKAGDKKEGSEESAEGGKSEEQL